MYFNYICTLQVGPDNVLLTISVLYRLDPTNVFASESMMRVEKHGDGGADTTYDVEVEDMENSVSEVIIEWEH